MFSGIEHEKIETVVPIAEVVTCAGFLFICFLEECIHHFVHPHKNSKPKNIQTKKIPDSQDYSNHHEFELYDAKLKNEEKIHKSRNTTVENDSINTFEEKQEDQLEGVANRTKSLLRTAFVVTSLSFHSLITGLTLGLEKEATGVWVTFAAISSHKFVIAFSVGVELVTSKVILIFNLESNNF